MPHHFLELLTLSNSLTNTVFRWTQKTTGPAEIRRCKRRCDVAATEFRVRLPLVTKVSPREEVSVEELQSSLEANSESSEYQKLPICTRGSLLHRIPQRHDVQDGLDWKRRTGHGFRAVLGVRHPQGSRSVARCGRAKSVICIDEDVQ